MLTSEATFMIDYGVDMTIIAVSSAVSFISQVAGEPFVLQVGAARESWLKWLLPSLVQTVVSLASIAAGVWIAHWSFTETSSRNRAEWQRDQLRAEWKELLVKTAGIEHRIPVLVTGVPNHSGLEQAILDVIPQLRGTIFVYPYLQSSGFIEKWFSLLEYISGRFATNTGVYRSIATGTLGEPTSASDLERWHNLSTEAEVEVRKQFHALLNELRMLAHQSIEGSEVERKTADPARS